MDKLTFRQKTAVEGEISFILSTSNSDSEILYRGYLCISNAPENLKPYIFETFKELTCFPENTYITLKAELGVDEPPMWIWEDKIIEDIKEALYISDFYNPEKTNINRSELRRKIIKSAFLLLCTKVGGNYMEELEPLCNKVLNERKLEFLHESCFYLLTSLSEEKENNNLPELSKEEKIEALNKVFSLTFDIHDFLSFQVELKSLSIKSMLDEKEESTNEDIKLIKMVDEDGNVKDISEDIKEILSSVLPNLSKKGDKKNKNSFIVKKIFNSSKCSTTLKTFDSEEEAEEFIEEIAEQYPEILNTCSFVIENKNNPDILKVFKK